jgi:hypothetical protein
MSANLRIHPAIGFARVGNSEDYYLQPETIAAMPQAGQTVNGGLPIKKGTENSHITSGEVRDSGGKLKRQGARFRIFQYQAGAQQAYPSPAGEEVVIGSVVDGKRVTDIIWTVHLANKKANCWMIDESANKGLALYENGNTPPLRNKNFANTQGDPANPVRLRKLIIDAGPRCLGALQSKGQSIKFNQDTTASYWQTSSNSITPLPDYPQTYPAIEGADPDNKIDYLGEMLTEKNGRLIVLGGFGKACGFDQHGNFDPNSPLPRDVDNDNWLDDTSDGPVTAVLVFEDGSTRSLLNNAWVICTDPAYAPQTLNVVTLWDDVYTTWVEGLGVNPALYNVQTKTYNPGYIPDFHNDVFPTLRAAEMQRWNTNLPDAAIKSHMRMDALTNEKPGFDIMSFIRKPTDNPDDHLETGAPLMPLSLGDADKSFMVLANTQHFLMGQWAKGLCANNAKPTTATPLGQGEALDRTVLMNCLGGRFSPGIDMTFIVRDPNLFNQDWKNPDIGPFRINMERLDYTSASKSKPFLGVGYIPLRTHPVQPGDASKFMAIPWHTDYNSCATHTPAPNPNGNITKQNIYAGDVNTTLFWSWPAQRPVAVYTFEDLAKRNDNSLPLQRYSLRGKGTSSSGQDITFNNHGVLENSPASNVGRFQDRKDIIKHWQDIGVVIQGAAIDNYPDKFDPGYYLEVQSKFSQDESNLVQPWPNTVTDNVEPPEK